MKAAIDGQSAKLAEFDAKESIKLQNKIKAQQEKAKSLSNMKPGDIVQYYDSASSSQIGTTWSKIAESTKDQKNANANKQFILDLINTLRVKNGQDILPDSKLLVIDSKGNLTYNDSYIPWGDQKITNLAKLADPLTYMNVDVTFGNNTTPLTPKINFSVSEYNKEHNTNFTITDFQSDSNYVNKYTIVP
jgi:hypothetical protein